MAQFTEVYQTKQEEGESVFISMTDLTVSFLFIVLILLAFFATQINPDAIEFSKHKEVQLEVVDLKNKLDDLQKQIRDLVHQISVIETTNVDLERVVIIQQQELEELLNVKEELLARVNSIKGELEKSTEYSESLVEKIKALEKDVEKLSRSVEEQRESLRVQIAGSEVADELAKYLEDATNSRVQLLRKLKIRIQKTIPDIQLEVIESDGVIRFRGGQLFNSGQWRVVAGSLTERIARALSDALVNTLPCYTFGSKANFSEECNSNFVAIETVQIEGHTDQIPLSQSLKISEKLLDNRDLSARRGAAILRAMTDEYNEELIEFLNVGGQPVLSFAGYGAMRPIEIGSTDEINAANRRIDIRFILHTPQSIHEVQAIRNRLRNNLPNL